MRVRRAALGLIAIIVGLLSALVTGDLGFLISGTLAAFVLSVIDWATDGALSKLIYREE